jgi:hypothetical protein
MTRADQDIEEKGAGKERKKRRVGEREVEGKEEKIRWNRRKRKKRIISEEIKEEVRRGRCVRDRNYRIKMKRRWKRKW